ncbi:MAG: diacylglycerol kinase family protein [Gelidibacter sp.]|uniref:diacylglycerol kinase family protein n=1 Tax=Gelidibacter sp. TaxID=2018083 RepID=UPI0032646E40
MSQKKDSLLVNRLKSIGWAYKGALILLRTEASIKIQFAIAILVTIAGFYFEISTTEWLFQVAMIGLVMSIEGVNTAIEAIADFVHPDHHASIGHIKDVAAGAVFIAAISAIIVAAVIYYPKLF